MDTGSVPFHAVQHVGRRCSADAGRRDAHRDGTDVARYHRGARIRDPARRQHWHRLRPVPARAGRGRADPRGVAAGPARCLHPARAADLRVRCDARGHHHRAGERVANPDRHRGGGARGRAAPDRGQPRARALAGASGQDHSAPGDRGADRRGGPDRGGDCAGRGDHGRDRAQPPWPRLRDDRGAAEAAGRHPVCADPVDRMCRCAVQPAGRAGRAALAAARVMRLPRHAIVTHVGAAAFALAVLLAWQYSVDQRILSPIFVASPSSIGSALTSLALSGDLWGALEPTLWRMLGGWGAASVLGIALGAVVGLSSRLALYLNSTLEFFRQLPAAVVIPPAILLLGLSEQMMISVIAFGAAWPILLATVHGFGSIDHRLREVALMMEMTAPAFFWKVALRAATPDILAGGRMSLAIALILTIEVEM